MGKTEVEGTPIVVVSSPGVRGRQRWVASVPVEEMVAEVRKRIPTDAIAELSDQRLSQQQAAKLNLRPGTFGSSIRLVVVGPGRGRTYAVPNPRAKYG
jgi:hypothetical protein